MFVRISCKHLTALALLLPLSFYSNPAFSIEIYKYFFGGDCRHAGTVAYSGTALEACKEVAEARFNTQRVYVDDWGTCRSTDNFYPRAWPCPIDDMNFNVAINNGEAKQCPAMKGNPINVAAGNKYQKELDIVDLQSIKLLRHYNSNADEAYNAHLGSKWRHSFDRRISGSFSHEGVYYSNQHVIARVEQADGKHYYFENEFIVAFGTTVRTQWSTDGNVTLKLETINDPDTGRMSGYRLTQSDDSIENYAVSGNLLSIETLSGMKQTLEYNAVSGLLERVSSNIGESLTFGYDAQARMTTITDHSGRRWLYSYDDNNNLAEIKYPDATPDDDSDNPSRLYHYESPLPHLLTGITDERGIRYATFAYNAAGQATLSTHANNAQRVDISYNSTFRTVTDSLGRSSNYRIITHLGEMLATEVDGPACASCGGSQLRYEFDLATNFMVAKTEDGVRTEWGNYDSKGNAGYKIVAKGRTEQRRYDYAYDSRFQSKLSSNTEASVFAGYNKSTLYGYDAYGNLTQLTIRGYTRNSAGDVLPISRTVNFKYDGPLHQLSEIDGPQPNTTDSQDITRLFYYPNEDTQGNNRSRLQRIVSPTAAVLRDNIQYNANGKILSELRANGLHVDYRYYVGNERLETLSLSDGSSTRVTRWTYLPSGEVETITLAYGSSDAESIRFHYDDARRLVGISNALGQRIEYVLDTEGNKTAEKYFDEQNILRRSLSQTFDLYNRIDHFEQVNEFKNYDFNVNGTLAKVTDGNGIVTQFNYDALKRLTQRTQNLGGNDSQTANLVTQYRYDQQDNLTLVIDPNHGQTDYVYDDLGQLIRSQSPDSGQTTFAYDAAGNLHETIDANGNRFIYSYDVLNRLTLLDAPGDDDDIRYSYDTCENGIGRLCAVVRGIGASAQETDYSYTAFGEISRHQGVSYLYNLAGRLIMLTTPSGMQLRYSYDVAGLIRQVSVINGNGQTTILASDIQRAPFGPVTALTFGNGHTLTQSFDTAYRVSAQILPGLYEKDSYHYDTNGNVLSLSDRLNNDSASYGYDAVGRLKQSVDRHGVQDLGYDTNGNRLQKSDNGVTHNYVYEAQSNRMDFSDDVDVILDANGNTVDDGQHQFEYNSFNQLVAVTDTALYRYNGLGQRIYKEVKGLPGDCNGDGFIDEKDTQCTLQQLNGQHGANSGGTSAAADCDGNGIVNGKDIACAAQQIGDYKNQGQGLVNGQGQGLSHIDPTANTGVAANARLSFVYTTDGRLLGEYTTTGKLVREYVYVNGQPIAVIKPSGIFYIHTDHLGTPRLVSDNSGRAVWSWESTPFGETKANDDPDGDGNRFEFSLRFAGQYYDGETGLHYNYYRYYDPSTGRYISSDPIGLYGGMNTYAYVSNNPLGYTDFLGLKPGDKFKTPDDAFLDAKNYARKFTNQTIEYAGWIFKSGNCWEYNFKAGDTGSVSSLEEIRPENSRIIWHTHPKTGDPRRRSQEESFSGNLSLPKYFKGMDTENNGYGDLNVARDNHFGMYLNTPMNTNVYFDYDAKPNFKFLDDKEPQSCSCQK